MALSFGQFIKESFSPASYSDGGRLPFVDLAKGICIILVVIFHIDDTVILPNMEALRMPLYFTLSGIFFKSYGSAKVFFLKKFNNILIPFVFWVSLPLLLLPVFGLDAGSDISSFADLSSALFHETSFPNSPVWFLLCLFFANLYFLALTIVLGDRYLIWGVLCFSLIGIACSLLDFNLPLWLDTAFTSLPFFYLGYLLKSSLDRHSSLLPPVFKKFSQTSTPAIAPKTTPLSSSERSNRFSLLITGLVFIAASFLIYFFVEKSSFSMVSNYVGENPVISYVKSFFIVLGCLLACKAIIWLPLISFFGRYSIIVLCTHRLIISTIQHSLSRFFDLSYSSPVLYLPLVLLVCWLAIFLCRNFLPFFTAQKPLLPIPTT